MAMHHGVDHAENFPVASMLCPPTLRAPIIAIYRFARTADDLADEGDDHATVRLADLAEYRADLIACNDPAFTSRRWQHVFGPLGRAIASHGLPLALLLDLLAAFEHDVRHTQAFAAHGTAYASHDDLIAYCRLSANPVGRLMLHLHGVRDAASLAQSDGICTALQLINFWQDLSVDIPRQRHYVPDELLHAHGLARADLVRRIDTPETSKLIANLCDLAGHHMRMGQGLCWQLQGRAGWELRLVVQGGWRILAKIAAMNHRTLARRPRITAWDAPALLWHALAMRRGA